MEEWKVLLIDKLTYRLYGEKENTMKNYDFIVTRRSCCSITVMAEDREQARRALTRHVKTDAFEEYFSTWKNVDEEEILDFHDITDPDDADEETADIIAAKILSEH